MDSIMVSGEVLIWQRRVPDQPPGALSQGHVSLTQSDLAADSGTAEQ